MARYNKALAQKENGFTLVELSITMAIIGLLIATVIAGAHLLHVARLNAVVTDLAQFRSAIDLFEEKYHAMPGDMPNAASFWGTSCVTSGLNTCNGDGDGRIEYQATTLFEDIRAWQHLALANMLPGGYTGLVSGTRYAIGTNAPGSQLRGGGYWLARPPAPLYGDAGNAIMLGSLNNGVFDGAILNAEDAHIIDTKADDGGLSGTTAVGENSGSIYIGRGANMGASGNPCASDVFAAASAELNFSDGGGVTCRLVYWIRKD